MGTGDMPVPISHPANAAGAIVVSSGSGKTPDPDGVTTGGRRKLSRIRRVSYSNERRNG